MSVPEGLVSALYCIEFQRKYGTDVLNGPVTHIHTEEYWSFKVARKYTLSTVVKHEDILLEQHLAQVHCDNVPKLHIHMKEHLSSKVAKYYILLTVVKHEAILLEPLAHVHRDIVSKLPAQAL